MRAGELQNAFPYFQPIVRRDDANVFAYEVLGRIEREGKVYSLGPFFEDPAIPDAEKLAIDLIIREKAFATYAAEERKAKLVINLKPSWVFNCSDASSKAHTLKLIEKYNLDPTNIVIEITEEELLGDMDKFSRLVSQYRKAGCMLAIDDFGKGASSIDRIAYLTPDIIKIDSSIVRQVDQQRSFFDISNAMSSFGSFSGFDILFEGIETPYELEACIEARGRYYQGYIFSKARPKMDGDFENRELLRGIIAMSQYQTFARMERRQRIIDEIKNCVQGLYTVAYPTPDSLALPEALMPLTKALPPYCLLCFVCDKFGTEISYRYGLTHSETIVSDMRGTCWFYNDFFNSGLYELHSGREAYLSGRYKNVLTKGDVVTYMQPLPGDLCLCVDILCLDDL